jgi:Holliday junction resolvasome RuvABC ATP-dependent DNA helicase subunit
MADCKKLKAPRDLLAYLTNASFGSILTLSGLESLHSNCCRFLEPAVTDFRVDITLGDGLNARTINMKLQPFTFIGTTEDLDKVPAFLRQAATVLDLGSPPPEMVAAYICRRIRKCPPCLASVIVEECNPAPGEAVELTRRLIEYGLAVADGKLSRDIIRQALIALGIRSTPMVDSGQTPKRMAIPSSVREFVWRRDGGKCVRCGSRIRLEFDHIVPVSKGGSNTARNIELLCESCNRRKGASIALGD